MPDDELPRRNRPGRNRSPAPPPRHAGGFTNDDDRFRRPDPGADVSPLQEPDGSDGLLPRRFLLHPVPGPLLLEAAATLIFGIVERPLPQPPPDRRRHGTCHLRHRDGRSDQPGKLGRCPHGRRPRHCGHEIGQRTQGRAFANQTGKLLGAESEAELFPEERPGPQDHAPGGQAAEESRHCLRGGRRHGGGNAHGRQHTTARPWTCCSRPKGSSHSFPPPFCPKNYEAGRPRRPEIAPAA